MSNPQKDMTTREKLAVILFLWLIQILAPWEYDHKQTEWIDKIKQFI